MSRYYGVEFPGPFEAHHIVTVDGCQVPHLTARLADGEVTLLLDERFAIAGTPLEAAKWVRFMADAMAVAAGYSCFGENAIALNPFKRRAGLSTGEEPEQ